MALGNTNNKVKINMSSDFETFELRHVKALFILFI